MKTYTITAYTEDEHGLSDELGEVEIRAENYTAANILAAALFENTGLIVSCEEKEENER